MKRCAVHPRLAYVPGDVSLWPNLSGGRHGAGHGGVRVGTSPPGTTAVLVPLTVLTALAALLTAVGYLGWRRRDLAD